MNLADAVLRLAPLEAQLPSPLGLPARAVPGDNELVDALFAAAGMRAPRCAVPGDTLSAIEQMAARTLDGAGALGQGQDPAAALAAARSRGLDGVGERHLVDAGGGVRLSAVRAGQAIDGFPVLLMGAPGMPLEMVASWLRGLGARRQVASWETRGMFGPDWEQVAELEVEHQVADAVVMLDAAGWPQAHLVGICGGAVLALACAARHPQRVRSLTLWFGDFDLGDAAPKTEHQRNLQALMQMVVSRRVSAQALRDVLVASMVKMSDPDLAPLAMYPFANAALLEQYCNMNYPIMSTDCRPYLSAVGAPCLVGYGPDDQTTHPDGSRAVAESLGAQLAPVPKRNHLDSMRAYPDDVARVLGFQQLHD